MRMGLVREVKITFDASTNSFVIPVVIELDPSPFLAGENTAHAAGRVHAIIGDMVRNGLRAELASANLLTGALAVALEIEAGGARSGASARTSLGCRKSRPPDPPIVLQRTN